MRGGRAGPLMFSPGGSGSGLGFRLGLRGVVELLESWFDCC